MAWPRRGDAIAGAGLWEKDTDQDPLEEYGTTRSNPRDHLEGGVNQVRARAHQVTTRIREQAEELQLRDQEVVDDERERWSPVVEAGKSAVHGVWDQALF